MAKTRTFIAIAASGETRQKAMNLIERLQPLAPGVKWVHKVNLHWTLQFLGDVNDNLLPAVCSVVAEPAGRFEPFGLEACGAGAFPSVEKPRTLWLGAGQGSEELTELQGAVEESLTELGFSGETRRYVPHLTLGRAARGLRLNDLGAHLQEFAEYDGGVTPVDEVVIYGSKISSEGPAYHVIGRVPLAIE